ncbi:histone H5, AT hook-like protein [Artemisia annua]|uniref:Histone H5, AT hook-like protein n=1 Tax=Artemisia annua TaxID=35608 RepID=A0A2U1LPW7_ARTAN|nr:histone H5, AT hook-like protein [Artemisia annua]
MDPNPIPTTDLPQQPPSPSMTSITTFAQPISTVPSPTTTLHPPYNEMIRAAIVGLKDRDGSSRQAISKYIEKEFGHANLPVTHSVMLTHHLKRLRDEGQIIMVKHSYMLPPGSVVFSNDNNVSTLDFSNPSGGNNGSGVNGSPSLAKRKPGRPPKLKPVPAGSGGSGLHNVQVMHDANVQQSYQPAFPFEGQGVQGQGGGEGGGEPMFVSLGLGDEGAAVEKVEKEKEKGEGESTGVKRGRGRPPKKKGGSTGRPRKKAVTGENGGSEVKGAAGEVKGVAGGDEVEKVADGGGETSGVKRPRGRPVRKGKMIAAPTGGNGRLTRPRGRPARIGSGAPVTVPLAGNVLKPRGRPKRMGRPVVNSVNVVRGSRRPPGRPSVNKVTNLTGLQLARPAKDGPGTALLVTDPRQLVVYQELMSKYELLVSEK